MSGDGRSSASGGGARASPPLPPPSLRLHRAVSAAAYARQVVAHLQTSGVRIGPGLTAAEAERAEAAHNLKLPADLRALLRAGLPEGPAFPDWRASSAGGCAVVEGLLALPAATVARAAADADGFWWPGWGAPPADPAARATAAVAGAAAAPPLVPLYGPFYVPASPCLSGNPVLCVTPNSVSLAGLDLPDFFEREPVRRQGAYEVPLELLAFDFVGKSDERFLRAWEQEAERRLTLCTAGTLPAPMWAAKAARHVPFWSDVVDWFRRRQEEEELAAATCVRDASFDELDGLDDNGVLFEGNLLEHPDFFGELDSAAAIHRGRDDDNVADAASSGRCWDNVYSSVGGEGDVVCWGSNPYTQDLAAHLLKGGWSEVQVMEALGPLESGSDADGATSESSSTSSTASIGASSVAAPLSCISSVEELEQSLALLCDALQRGGWQEDEAAAALGLADC